MKRQRTTDWRAPNGDKPRQECEAPLDKSGRPPNFTEQAGAQTTRSLFILSPCCRDPARLATLNATLTYRLGTRKQDIATLRKACIGFDVR